MLPILLESAATDGKDVTPMLVWCGIATGVVLFLVIAISIVRKKFFPPEETDHAPAGFGVGDLKDLYDQGLISDDEYNTAKEKIVKASHAAFMNNGSMGKSVKK